MTRSRNHTSTLIALLIVSFATFTTAAEEQSDEVIVRGIVLDPAGKPAAGARLQTVAWPFKAALSESRSAADGSFTITFKKSQFASTWRSWESTVVVATRQGFAPDWSGWDHTDTSGNLVLHLAPDDISIEGRILNLEGQGVANASITLTNLRNQAVDLKSLGINASPPLEEYGNEATPELPGFATAILQPILTDAEGRFRITGVGRNRTVDLSIRGPAMANSGMRLVTRDVGKQSRTFQYQPMAQTSTLYGAKFEFTVPPGRVVTGTVRDAETGQPMAGVSILDGSQSGPVTDKDGRYRREGIPKRKGMKLIATPNDDQPYFMCEGDIPDAEGMAPITLDFNLHRGVWVTGTVTDRSTNKPIASARLYYLPYLSNKNFDKLSEFHHNARAQIPGGQSERYLTKADGTFRLVALPGPALVTASAIGRNYRTQLDLDQIKCPRGPGRAFLTYEPRTSGEFDNTVKELNIPDGGKDAMLDLQCDPGQTIHLTLVDSNREPVTGAIVLHHAPGSPYHKFKTNTLDAVAFRPDERRRLFILHAARKIGRIITLGPADAPNGKMTIILEPFSNITARLLGQDGQPLANAAVQGFPFELPLASTDVDGKFTMPIVPGMPYDLRGFKDGQEFFSDVQNLTLPPGSSKDLGDIHRKSFR